MGGNRYEIVVDLPKADGFSVTSDLAIAEIVQDAIRNALSAPTVPQGCTVHLMAK